MKTFRTLTLVLVALLLPRPAGAQTYETLFADNTGRPRSVTLVQGSDGNFYGTSDSGGASDVGTVFKMTPAGALTTLVSFNRTNGMSPYAGLVVGSDGNFYGTS